MKKIFSALMVLVLLLSILPMAASAAKKVEISGYESATHIQQAGSGKYVTTFVFADGSVITSYDGAITSSTRAGFAPGDTISGVVDNGKQVYIAAHIHAYEWTVNRDGHFYRCKCGAKHKFQEHTMGDDGTCVCGYKFMDNADLTVLWMSGIQLSPRFQKDVTEYEGKLLVKDLEKIKKLTAFSFDAKATIELPEDLTLKEGKNVFEVKVTAENGKVTKTYTVTVNKE